MEKINKVVLLIGCTGTLGTFFVERYSHLYTIVGVARNKPKYVVDSLDFFEADICEDAERIAKYVLDKYKKIDALINNAVFSRWKELRAKTTEEFEQELRTNVVAPLNLANEVLNKFWAREKPEENASIKRCVVNVSSIASVKVYENTGQGTYAASKAALNILTKHMASEYIKYGIRVNGIAPNTFPSYISLERVGSAIAGFMEGGQNGEIKIMDQNDEYIF